MLRLSVVDMAQITALHSNVEVLAELPRADLTKQWHTLYHCPPPKGVKRQFLERAIAWHMQAKHYGGHKPAIVRQLRRISERAFEQKSDGCDCPATSEAGTGRMKSLRALSPTNKLTLGTRLVREWHGRSHVVDVVEQGFVYDGKTFKSLSAIARAITGARWSGPRFFGL